MNREAMLQHVADRVPPAATAEQTLAWKSWTHQGYHFRGNESELRVTTGGPDTVAVITFAEVEAAINGQDQLFAGVDGRTTAGGDTIQARFERFRAANPDVYRLLVELAKRANVNGKRVGMKALWERLRWELYVETITEEPEDFKLANDFTSRYARLIMEQEPELSGFFETRALRAE